MYVSKTIEDNRKLAAKSGLSVDERRALFEGAVGIVQLLYSLKNQEISPLDTMKKHLRYVITPEFEGVRFVDGQGGECYDATVFQLHSAYYNTEGKAVLVLCLAENPSDLPLEIMGVVQGNDDDYPELIEGWYLENVRPAMDAKLVP